MTIANISNLADLGAGAVGRRLFAEEVVSLSLVRRLAATLNENPAIYAEGSILPPGWHQILFAPLEPTNELGPDGHPRLGDFVPDFGLPRRLFGGRELQFHQPLHIGQKVTRETEIVSVDPKEGRSGLMMAVTVEHRLSVDGALALVERQTIIYRGNTTVEKKSQSGEAELETGFDWEATTTPDHPMLFRYSAVTFNAHRIHYDEDYTRDVEGYPACLTNGGLTALLMLGHARSNGWEKIARFSIRNLRPLFVGQPITIAGRRNPETPDVEGTLFALDRSGQVAARANVSFS